MLVYLGLALLFVLAGRGLLRLGRAGLPGSAGLFLAPLAALACLAVVLEWCLLSGVTARSASFVIWPALAALAALGLRGVVGDIRQAGPGLLFLVLVLPPLILAPAFWHGLADYAGSAFPDRWYYQADAVYLWRRTDFATPIPDLPLLEYARGHHRYRFLSGAVMAFLSPLLGRPGDGLVAANLFSALGVFTYASACAFFSAAWGLFPSRLATGTFLLLAVASGWTVNVVAAQNCDNLATLCVLPGLIGLVPLLDPRRPGQALVAGAICAMSMLWYPEAFPLLAMAAFFPLAGRIWSDGRAAFSAWAVFTGQMILFSLVLIALAAPVLWLQYVYQLGLGFVSGVLRPGEGYFAGLTGLSCLGPTLLGHVLPLEPCATLTSTALGRAAGLIGPLLGVLVLVGAVRLALTRSVGLLLSALSLAGVGTWLILAKDYDYGGYKLILLCWWLLAAMAVMGALRPRRRAEATGPAGRWRFSGPWTGAAVAVLVAHLAMVAWLALRAEAMVSPKTAERFRTLPKVLDTLAGEPAILALSDPALIPWTLFALPETPLFPVGPPHEYFSAKTMPEWSQDQAAPRARRLLTDAPVGVAGAFKVWSGGGFQLYILPESWALLGDVSAPAGPRFVEGRLFYRLTDGRDLSIETWTGGDKPVQARLVVSLAPDPGAPTELFIEDALGRREIRPETTVGRLEIPVTLVPGRGSLRLGLAGAGGGVGRGAHAGAFGLLVGPRGRLR